MTSAEWRRVRDLFEQALDEQPSDLDAWLDRVAPADDSAVRAEVASLLQHSSRVGHFLAEPLSERLAVLLADDHALEPGHSVGPYTVVRELGRGGMGRVYLANDARLGRRVALKALAPWLTSDPAQRERLRREARAAARLTHPGICTVYALEELNGDLFIASEFVDGRTLREEIASGRRPLGRDVRATARELAAALASAHASGITHRDLKPENVMRTSDGRLKILDFGLARADGQSPDPIAARLTQAGALVGTPAYMAPEQLNGEVADARADVFAFGVLVYEYACGAHPFEAPTPLAMVARVLESDARPLDSRCPDLPPAVAAVIERCLRKAPADRFASASEIVHALSAGDDVRPRVVRWWRTHQLIVIGLYVMASAAAWQIKEWRQGPATAIFVIMGIAAAIGGVFRGHLVFTEHMNRSHLTAERRRAGPVTALIDGAMALALGVDGLMLAPAEPLTAVLLFGLAVGLALARIVLEPATTAAAFGAEGR